MTGTEEAHGAGNIGFFVGYNFWTTRPSGTGAPWNQRDLRLNLNTNSTNHTPN
jgi:hypothetical protein